MTATVGPFTDPDLGIDEPHYLAEHAAIVSGRSQRTLQRRAKAGELVCRHWRGLACYPVDQIHALRQEPPRQRGRRTCETKE